MDKKLFLFDCDGVLVDSLSVFEGTVRLGTEVVATISIQAFRPEENT